MSKDDWANISRKNRKLQEVWDEQVPDGFVDVPVKENMTGKAKQPSTSEPTKGSSLDTL